MDNERTEITKIPAWMCGQEEYIPANDRESFLTKSTKSVLSVLAKLRFNEGKDSRFSAAPSLKLFYTIFFIILTASARNYLFVLIMCATVTVRLAFFFSCSHPTDLKWNSRSSSDFDTFSFAGCIYGKSTSSGQYNSESICICNIGGDIVIRHIVE